MKDEPLERALNDLVEELAAFEHERWAHWQRYMHSKGIPQPDGSLLLPAELVARWQRQVATKYADLDDKQKESDREQVRRYLPLITSALAGRKIG
jgi:hypothetical protein